jgi:predicted RNA binding protein YcfA (HicA-like mRNA interferase family)
MPKLPVFTSKNLIKLLEQKGFRLDHATGSHFIFHCQELSKRVVVPCHNKDLPKGTLLSILKQAGINKDDL